ncbi:hypothetical protein NIES2107_18000 [Nostoc carneum NIES-2107]|nr:hypothetical protein NIES2107_18000 [Nostoc carneum NIES-2107]
MLSIQDLSYLENAPENQLIAGGASAMIGAIASAVGDASLTYTNTDLNLKVKRNGGVKLKGVGVAFASGDDYDADVYYYLEGFDKVKVKTINKYGPNYELEIVKIRAIDKPNK